MDGEKDDWTKEIWSGVIQCDCHAHGVELWVDADEDDVEDRIGGVVFWYHAGHDHHLGFWNRLKEAWRILCGLRINVEDIIVREEGARLLSQRFADLADAIKRGPEKKDNKHD